MNHFTLRFGGVLLTLLLGTVLFPKLPTVHKYSQTYYREPIGLTIGFRGGLFSSA